MTDKKLYQSLIEIGLKNYLKQRGKDNIYQEPHMLKIDSFVENLSDNQKKILKDKISKKKNETHSQHNDVFHEISIAYVFYNNVNFLSEQNNKKTPDFCSDGIYVEVKTINNSDVERKRLDDLDKGPYCNISPVLNQDEVEKIKKEFIECMGKKFTDHINKAKEQLDSSSGHIWIVYAIDQPYEIRKSKIAEIKIEIENKFDEIITETSSKYNIRPIYFKELRDKIKNK